MQARRRASGGARAGPSHRPRSSLRESRSRDDVVGMTRESSPYVLCQEPRFVLPLAGPLGAALLGAIAVLSLS